MTIEAAAADGAGGPAKFTMVAYTGKPMRPGRWKSEVPIILDISAMRKPASGRVPIHRDHKPDKVVGHSETIQAKGGRVVIQGVLSASNDHSREVLEASRNNFPWQASVGARLMQPPRFVRAGETVQVNGQTVAGPVYVSRAWQLRESSFVSMGADDTTSAVAAKAKGVHMNKFHQWLEASGFDPDELSDEALATLKTAWQREIAAQENDESAGDVEAGDGGEQEDLEAGDVGEGESDAGSAKRQEIAAAYRQEALVEKHLGNHPAELRAQAMEEEWDESHIKAQAELHDLRARYSTGPGIHMVDRSSDAGSVECALFINAGVGSDEQAVEVFGEKTVTKARGAHPRSAGIQWFIHEFLRANGRSAHPGVFDDDTIRAAFRMDQQMMIQASSGFSTISLSGTLSNLANKALLSAYNEIVSVIPRICRTATHSDFKSHTRYRVTSPGLLNKLGATGEIEHTELDEDTYSNQVETFARMMALTRQMMRNDDLNAFLQIPQMFGRMSARTKERSVFSVLLNNADSFFNTSPSGASGLKPNALAAGASSALSATSLGAAETLFWNQTDKHGNPIDLVPSLLLVAPAKYRDAVNLLNRTTMTVIGDPTTGEQIRVGNEYIGEFEPVKSPYVSAPSLTGNSATQWWLLAKPSADAAILEIAYLDGRSTPIIESAETDFNTLGMQWRAYHDWGVAKQDPRAGVYSPGA